MEGINSGKLIVSSMVAGGVMALSQLVLNEGVIADQQQASLDALGVAAPSGSQIGMFVLMTFITAGTMMWLYIVLRDRLGAGANTAMCVGSVVWVLRYLMGLGNFWVLGILGTPVVGIALVWGLVELPLAALAGAYFYSD